MKDQEFRRVLVLGLAASGEAATRLLLRQGAKVFAVDHSDTDKLKSVAAGLEREGARVFLGCSSLPAEPWSLAVISPGVRADSPVLSGLVKRGVPLVSELELGWRCAKRPTLAVTGANGKSTLTALCVAALKAAGKKAVAAGNFGPPVSRVVLEEPCLDWLVLEVSSFQLETVADFRPEIGVLLNVLPNHLDRHGNFENYRAIKMRLFGKMRAHDVAVAPENMLDELKARKTASNKCLGFGVSMKADFRYEHGRVVAGAREGFKEQTLELSESYFDNDVLGLAAAAAFAATNAAGISKNCLEQAIREFRPLPHRLQEVASCRGVRFVDDSKATNLAAMLAALRMTSAPIRLIAGGLPKHEPFEPANPLLRERVETVYLIGKAAPDMAAAWAGIVKCLAFPSLDAAMKQAWADAKSGDTILLAPACASFDQFRSFEERGEQFAALAQALIKNVAP